MANCSKVIEAASTSQTTEVTYLSAPTLAILTKTNYSNIKNHATNTLNKLIPLPIPNSNYFQALHFCMSRMKSFGIWREF